MKNLLCEVKFLRSELKSIKREDKLVPLKGPESNSIMSHKGDPPIDASIPAKISIVPDGRLRGKAAKVLKVDVSNANVVSMSPFKDNRKLFVIEIVRSCVNHFKNSTFEKLSELILSGTLKLGVHKYNSNWVVASARYDVQLGMP